MFHGYNVSTYYSRVLEYSNQSHLLKHSLHRNCMQYIQTYMPMFYEDFYKYPFSLSRDVMKRYTGNGGSTVIPLSVLLTIPIHDQTGFKQLDELVQYEIIYSIMCKCVGIADYWRGLSNNNNKEQKEEVEGSIVRLNYALNIQYKHVHSILALLQLKSNPLPAHKHKQAPNQSAAVRLPRDVCIFLDADHNNFMVTVQKMRK